MSRTIRNNKKKGQWVRYRISGYPGKVFVPANQSVTLPYINFDDQLNLTSADDAAWHQIKRGKVFNNGQKYIAVETPATTTESLGENLVVDGTFEAADPTTAWSFGDGTLTRDTEVVYAGTASGNLENNMMMKEGTYRYQTISVESGKRYKFECAIKSRNMTTASVILRDGDTLDIIKTISSTDTSWSLQSEYFNNTSTTIRVYVVTDAFAGSVYFDAVSVKEVL